MSDKSRSARGFTIPELIVSITVLGILTGLVLGTLYDFYYSNSNSIGVSAQDTDTRSVLRQIESDITTSPQFLDTVTVENAIQGPNGSGTIWKYDGNPANTTNTAITTDPSNPNGNGLLIATSYATDATRSNLIFTDSGSGCDLSAASPIKTTLIYFVAKDTRTNLYNLYRRTIVPSQAAAPRCSGATVAQKSTCAVGSSSSFCAATDAILAYNVKDTGAFEVKYYANSTDADNLNATGAAIKSARTVKITVKTTQKINGKDKQSQATIRISRLQS